MVSALFVDRKSIYKELLADCWDIDRNAAGWPGGNAIIAHPPCRTWCRLKHFAQHIPGEKALAIKSIEWVRQWGGVVEHPKGSDLWKELKLPTGKKKDEWGGYTVSVDQSWFGHRARKSTLLYIVGCQATDLPAIPISFDAIQRVVSISTKKGGSLPEVTRSERSATPFALAKWLIQTAEICDQVKNIAGPGRD